MEETSIIANQEPTNMTNHEPTIMANENKTSAPKCYQENGIRIFDSMLFEDTVVSKIMEHFNTKCYDMNKEKKIFQ